MNRWLALLLAVLGGGIGGFVVGSAVMIGLYAMLWMFVFGDNSWPDWVMPALNVAHPLLCLALWVVFAWGISRGLTARRATGPGAN